MRSQVRVIIRTKPTDTVASAFRILPNNVVSVSRPMGVGARGPTATKAGINRAETAVKEETLTFSAAAVLHNASQESVYNTAVSDLIDSVLQGYSCTLLCYGQCGAGKTYTMFGTDTFSTRGCVQRAIEVLFEAIRTSTDRRYTVKVTFVEVYNEQVFDLLGKGPSASETAVATKRPGRDKNVDGGFNRQRTGSPNYDVANVPSNSKGDGKATVTISGEGTVVLRGVDERQCPTEADAVAAVSEGVGRRLTGANALNRESSRSHAVLTVYVTSTSLLDSDAVTLVSRMSFVDFAGSERTHATSTEAEKQEAHMINRSLIMLEQVILAVSSARSRHVPFRQSKLTMLLKDSLGGGTMTTIIANVWPQPEHMEATLATLNFAKRLMRVESNPTPNVALDAEAQIRVLQKQVNSLKSELRMQDQFAGRVAIPTAPLESDEINGARDIVMAYVEGSIPQIRVSCVREMYACFSVFKTLLLDMESQLRTAERSASPPPTSSQRAQQRTKNVARPTGSQEPKETPRHVNSTMDASVGVSVGTAERASTALGDMFQQQQLLQQQQQLPQPLQLPYQQQQHHQSITSPRDTFMPSTMRPGDRRISGAAAAAGRTLTPVTSASAAASDFPGGSNTTHRFKLNASSESASMLERDLGKDRSRPHGGRGSAIETRLEPGVAPTAGFVGPSSPAPGGKSLVRLESITRDKRAAFEIYKQTPSGICHVQAINSAQEKLARKNDEMHRLRQKVKDVQVVMERYGNFDPKRENAGPGGGHLPFIVPNGSPTQHVFNETTAGETGAEAMASATDSPGRPTDALDTSELEQLINMKPEERKLHLRHVTTALTRAKTEQSLLTSQLDRLREEFMNNFNYWHQMSLQSLVAQQVDKATIPMLKVDTIPSTR